jgi:hypothetical protein
MEQWEIENDRVWRGMLHIGIALVLILVMAMSVGIFLGYLIWGI